MKDYYALLGVDRGATKEEIKKNYRKLAIRYHPDKSSDPEAAAKFIIITEAYDVLSNKKARTQYDLFVWEKLKRKKHATEDDYNVVVPPRESTRTRRNKAQKKRGIEFQQTRGATNRFYLILKECLIIISRYAAHVFGLTLALVILQEVIGKLSEGFSNGIFAGVLVSLVILGILYSIFYLLRLIYTELKKDLEAFSVFYKFSQLKAASYVMPIFSIFLFLYVILLFRYF